MDTPKITYLQYGGKASIARWIASHFPPHRVYMEPFCGSCAVLFAKPPSFTEIVNDLDGRVISMFEQIRENPKELAALLWATPYSKENWREAKCSEDALEDARLLMAEGKQFYCGDGNSSTWAIDKTGAPHKSKSETWADWFLRILPAASRLRAVQILNEDGIAAIRRVHMQEDALIYVDPPYDGHARVCLLPGGRGHKGVLAPQGHGPGRPHRPQDMLRQPGGHGRGAGEDRRVSGCKTGGDRLYERRHGER